MHVTNSSPTQSIDRSKLLERCLGIEAFAEKIATAFVAKLPLERQALRAAIESSDWSLVARQAHRLRGSASNVCAQELSEAAEAVEEAARKDLVESALSLIANVETAIDRILTESANGSS
jgi:HPt (histidine-containing phosphotransfer) domain-containing protein